MDLIRNLVHLKQRCKLSMTYRQAQIDFYVYFKLANQMLYKEEEKKDTLHFVESQTNIHKLSPFIHAINRLHNGTICEHGKGETCF